MIGTLLAGRRRVRLKNMRPGLFLWRDELCLMTEYGNDAYIVRSGEAFWGGTTSKAARGELMVMPVNLGPVP